MTADWGAAVRSGRFDRIEPPSSISMATGIRIDLAKKAARFIMADTAALLALPDDQLREVYHKVVPERARRLDWQYWMPI